jgi:hypothetical protein
MKKMYILFIVDGEIPARANIPPRRLMLSQPLIERSCDYA